jgi:autoinducer 2-degrading protein
MYVLIVTIKIKPEHRESFMEAMLGDAVGSVSNEPGCFRFDVFEDEEDANTIYLNEVYRDKAALEDHTQAPHFIKWRDTVKDWFAETPQVAHCTNIFPTDADWNKYRKR